MDDYWKYHNTNIPSRKEWKKWEHPSSFNFIKLKRDINKIIKSEKENIILIEGFHMLSNKNIRDFLDLKIYINLPDNLIIRRRLEKFGASDKQEWYSREIVVKSYKKYGKPTKKYADLEFDGTNSINIIIKKIIQKYKSLSQKQ